VYHKEREEIYYSIEALPYRGMTSESAGPWILFCIILLYFSFKPSYTLHNILGSLDTSRSHPKAFLSPSVFRRFVSVENAETRTKVKAAPEKMTP